MLSVLIRTLTEENRIDRVSDTWTAVRRINAAELGVESSTYLLLNISRAVGSRGLFVENTG